MPRYNVSAVDFIGNYSSEWVSVLDSLFLFIFVYFLEFYRNCSFQFEFEFYSLWIFKHLRQKENAIFHIVTRLIPK